MMDMTPVNRAASQPLYVINQKPAISVVGLGYVGAVSTACLSALGHKVVGVDVDPAKVAQISAGDAPIYEKDLGRMLEQGVHAGLIQATDDLAQAVQDTDVTFVSVGTPTSEDGGCDYRYIKAAARSIGEGLAQKSEFHVVVMRCSIPPGTTMEVMTPIISEVSGKTLGKDFGVCFNPEFLREGIAVADFYESPKTVIGATCDRSANVMAQIYAPVDHAPIITSIEAAEMVKYVDNVWHATKVSFANEIGRICKPLGVDSHCVMDIFVQDTKLNLSPYYLKPGFAYGGSCLPKEVRAVAHLADQLGVDVPLIGALDQSNKAQIDRALQMLRDTGAKRVGVLGLAFKRGTDDLRESPILEVIAALREAGTEVIIHDTAITPQTPLDGQMAYVHHGAPGLQALARDLPSLLADDTEEVLDNADALIVTHADPLYRQVVRRAGAMPVIDVARLFAQPDAMPNCHGIAW